MCMPLSTRSSKNTSGSGLCRWFLHWCTLTKYVGETDSGVWPEGQLLAHDVLMHWLGNVCVAWSVSCCYAKVLQVLSLSKSHL